jgi:hypothetical protein
MDTHLEVVIIPELAVAAAGGEPRVNVCVQLNDGGRVGKGMAQFVCSLWPASRTVV